MIEIPLRVALIHDWLTGMRGGEKCLEVLCELFPDADLYTLIHNRGSVSPTIERMNIVSSFVQNLPFSRKRFRSYLPLFPTAIKRLNFDAYDLLISTSHCVAKGATPRKGALHISYCHTPMRYVWEMYDEYFGKGRAGLLTRVAMPPIARYLRRWDVKASEGVHYFVANSLNVKDRIRRHYHRDAEVIYPPVDASRFQLSNSQGTYYLIVSALAPYKRIDLAVDAFNKLGERLVIAGEGSEARRLRAKARGNIEFVGWVPEERLGAYYRSCTALIFPGEEDFGIVPLEAMACGKPVIAYGKGGALETVLDNGDRQTGILFPAQTVESLLEAVERFHATKFDAQKIREHALQFDRPIFTSKIRAFIEQKISEHFHTGKS